MQFFEKNLHFSKHRLNGYNFLRKTPAKRILTKFEKSYEELISLESDIKNLMMSAKKRKRYMMQMVADKLLKNVVQKRGVKAIIAERTCEFLSVFQMQCNPHTVRKYLENK